MRKISQVTCAAVFMALLQTKSGDDSPLPSTSKGGRPHSRRPFYSRRGIAKRKLGRQECYDRLGFASRLGRRNRDYAIVLSLRLAIRKASKAATRASLANPHRPLLCLQSRSLSLASASGKKDSHFEAACSGVDGLGHVPKSEKELSTVT